MRFFHMQGEAMAWPPQGGDDPITAFRALMNISSTLAELSEFLSADERGEVLAESDRCRDKARLCNPTDIRLFGIFYPVVAGRRV